MEEKFMEEALKQAQKAKREDEVPVGAVIVKNGKIISKSRNKKEKKRCAIFHAEIIAVQKASKKIKSWNLSGCEIYVTKQPCLMCYGAILSARIDKIYFGAYDKKYGIEVEQYKILNEKGFNQKAEVVGGILENECGDILTNFFKVKRG